MVMLKNLFLINFIEKIGFKFLEKSNINQNVKDTKDYKMEFGHFHQDLFSRRKE